MKCKQCQSFQSEDNLPVIAGGWCFCDDPSPKDGTSFSGEEEGCTFFCPKQPWCLRTDRPCENGAYDNGDGLGIDCLSSSPENCPYREET